MGGTPTHPHRLHRARQSLAEGAVESLVATYRREVLDAELFHSLLEAHVLTERWRRLYNERQPHSRLGYRPPITAYLPAREAIG